MNAPVPIRTDLIPLSDLQKMAEAIAKSNLFGMKDTAQALALMLTAQAEGQHPASITQDYDIIQGKATRKTHSVLARYQQAGGSIEWHALDEQKAEATFRPPLGAGKPLRLSWTVEMAEAAGLLGKDNWRKYRRAMLRARCIAEGVRATYPAALGGMMVSEEAADLDVVPGEVTGQGRVKIDGPELTGQGRVVVEGPKAKGEPACVLDTAPEAAEPSVSTTEARSHVEVDGLTDGAKATLRNAMKRHGITEENLKAAGYPAVDLMPFSRFNEVMNYIKGK